jgi:hypothetical protein
MKELWITNISKADISLSDLNITVKSMKSINLFGHTTITKEQIIKSYMSGSISKRKGVLFFRLTAPAKDKRKIECINNMLNNRAKSCLSITKKEMSDISELYKTDEDDKLIQDLLSEEE